MDLSHDFVSVTDYGATPDGVTDCYSAIEGALKAALAPAPTPSPTPSPTPTPPPSDDRKKPQG